MTPEQFDAICARDQDYNDIFEQQAQMSPHIAHRLVAWPVADRRALIEYVKELRADLATEVKNKKQFERDWLEACDQVSTLRAELAARLASVQEEADRRTREVEACYTVQRDLKARLAADEVLLNEAWRKNEVLRSRLAEAERSEGTLLGMIRHQRDVLRECLPYINESMAGKRPGRSADDIRAAVKALTSASADGPKGEK